MKAAITIYSLWWVKSNNVELADRRLLITTVLVEPLPTGGPGKGHAVLGLPAIRLRTFPVFVCDAGAGLVHPDALVHHIVDAQPDLLIRADAPADVISELVILVAGRGRAEDTTQVVTVLTGSMIAFSQRVSQVTLSVDLFAFQTDWREDKTRRADG